MDVASPAVEGATGTPSNAAPVGGKTLGKPFVLATRFLPDRDRRAERTGRVHG